MDADERPEPVLFDLKKPVRMGKRFEPARKGEVAIPAQVSIEILFRVE
jgi:hypothetical protein